MASLLAAQQHICEREVVAPRAKAANGAYGNIGDIRTMTERLPRMHVRKVNFDEGNLYARESIADCHACMRVSSGIDYDEAHAVPPRALDSVDQLAFVVALKALRCNTCRFCGINQAVIDVRQSLPTIHGRLARTEQI